MKSFTDQLGRRISVPFPPRRIISLVPSQTELLFDLGLEEEVVGITKFCVHPQNWFRTRTRIGGTKKINLEKILALQPDLIIANKEENEKEQVEALAEKFPVWVSHVTDLASALQMIVAIGQLTAKHSAAESIAAKITDNFHRCKRVYSNPQPKTCYLIWKRPYISVGGDTFIHAMLGWCGFQNIFAGSHRYPSLTVPDLQMLQCELLLLSSEPYPFKQKDIDELQLQLPHTQIELVDGEMFSWYGSRLLQAPAYFRQLRQRINAKP